MHKFSNTDDHCCPLSICIHIGYKSSECNFKEGGYQVNAKQTCNKSNS